MKRLVTIQFQVYKKLASLIVGLYLYWRRIKSKYKRGGSIYKLLLRPHMVPALTELTNIDKRHRADLWKFRNKQRVGMGEGREDVHKSFDSIIYKSK